MIVQPVIDQIGNSNDFVCGLRYRVECAINCTNDGVGGMSALNGRGAVSNSESGLRDELDYIYGGYLLQKLNFLSMNTIIYRKAIEAEAKSADAASHRFLYECTYSALKLL